MGTTAGRSSLLSYKITHRAPSTVKQACNQALLPPLSCLALAPMRVILKKSIWAFLSDMGKRSSDKLLPPGQFTNVCRQTNLVIWGILFQSSSICLLWTKRIEAHWKMHKTEAYPLNFNRCYLTGKLQSSFYLLSLRQCSTNSSLIPSFIKKEVNWSESKY